MYLKSVTTKSSNITNSCTWLTKHCRNSDGTPFILDHSKYFMLQMFPRLARLSSLHSDKVTKKKVRMITTMVYSDIPPNPSCGKASLPGQPNSSTAEGARGCPPGWSYLHAAVCQRHGVGVAGHALLLAVVGTGGWCQSIARVDIVGVNRLSPRPMPVREK